MGQNLREASEEVVEFLEALDASDNHYEGLKGLDFDTIPLSLSILMLTRDIEIGIDTR